MDAESYTLDGLRPSVCNVEGRAQTDDLKLDGPGQLWTVYGAKADGHESKLTVIRIVDGPNQSWCKSGRSKSAKVNDPKI